MNPSGSSATTSLLIDAGNTRLKWGLSAGGTLTSLGSVPLESLREAGSVAAFASFPAPRRVVVSNVAGAAVAEMLSRIAAERWQIEPRFVQVGASAFGVTNAYGRPLQMGVDRWVAIVAAWTAVRDLVCVADLGTAVTVDAVDADGHHLGGLIAAGRRLMIEGLLANTSELRRKHAESTGAAAGLLAADTHTAIENAARYSIAALVDRVMLELRERHGKVPHLLLTGGDARALSGAMRNRAEIRDDLVLQGLTLFAEEMR